MKNQTPTRKIILLLDKSTDFLKSDKISSLNFIAKILISLFLGIIGFLSLGLWVFIPIVGALVSIGLCISAFLGIRKIWQPRKVKGEGDIFKHTEKLNKE